MERQDMERQDMVLRLKHLANGLARIEDLLNRRTAAFAEIDRAAIGTEYEKKRIEEAQRTLEKAKKKRIPVVTIVAILFFVLAVRAYSSHAQHNPSDWKTASAFALLILFALIVLAVVLFLKAILSYSKKMKVRSAGKAIPDAHNKIAAYKNRSELLREQILPIDEQINTAYTDVQELMETFPPAYCYAEAVGKCAFYIENQRASSIPEAINLYVDESYKDAQLTEMKKQTAIQQATMLASIQTALNTGQIADNTTRMVGQLGRIENNTQQMAGSLQNMNPTVNTYVDVTVK